MVVRLTGRQIFAVNGTAPARHDRRAEPGALNPGDDSKRHEDLITTERVHRDHGEENTEKRNMTEQNEIDVGQLTQGIKCSWI